MVLFSAGVRSTTQLSLDSTTIVKGESLSTTTRKEVVEI
jgi:hypothetical protein